MNLNIQEHLTAALLKITYPLLNKTLDELGFKVTIIPENNKLTIRLLAGFPTQALETTLLPFIETRLAQSFPDLNMAIEINHFIPAYRTQLPGRGLRGVKNTIAIASGKGGVGKSTVAVNLAAALSKAGARVGILDADIYGPSIPMMLGATAPVAVQGDHYLPVQAQGLQAMSIGYLTDSEQALIWRGPMLAKSLLQMLDLTLWDDLDYLFIDLPPGTGDIQLSLVQKIPLTAAIVVTTPQNIATLDAQKAIKMFEKTGIDVLGLIENMAIHHCSACGHEESIFGEGGAQALSEKFNTPLLGQLPLDTRIRSQGDEGCPTAMLENNALSDLLMKIALQTAVALSRKPLNYADKFPPIVVE